MSNNIIDNVLADYDAPLTEEGAYGEKYYSAKNMIEQQDPLAGVLIKWFIVLYYCLIFEVNHYEIMFARPDMPDEVPPIALSEVTMTEWIDFRGLIDKIVRVFF